MFLNNLIKPEKLKAGDTIGIISPAGAVKEDNHWSPTINFFENKGFKVKIAPHAKAKNRYLAGTDKDRLDDLLSFFKDDSINAIICSRGGYGCNHLLENLDFDIIKNNPKIFVGYSDITILLNTFAEKAGLITFHGPLALSDFGNDKPENYTVSNFFDLLQGKVNLPYSYENPINYECIKSGIAEGQLVGGNLAVLTGLMGTPYFPDLTDKILLLEDVGEPLYKIDRMLMQLKLSGNLSKLKGLLFGEFTAIGKSDNPEDTPIKLIKELLGDLNIPIGLGFPASHGQIKATLPIGVKYKFNSSDFKLELVEEYLA